MHSKRKGPLRHVFDSKTQNRLEIICPTRRTGSPDHKRPSQRSLLPSFSVRGHRLKIVLGVLIVVLCPDRVADLGFGAGERQIPLIVSLRVLRAGAGGTRCPPLRAGSKRRCRSWLARTHDWLWA